ncbi:MAG: tripartite tricarboxylate transporter substrate-binding protein [Pigmentiphaga sp.]|uniref:Bug family tripartite tricarboxylate transporter substrate binding protein n=1 Tax=Pigmentiphaga sp. TaxID=1977564 RepID=UPI0029AC949E|nr:tripartite tricarboxylate transporter substrate-binding protein [Pigmentiphaga sp.]MDX3905134.1 tripartite tricarboxylate transporter substrate-binding protein [Pigmentiphaga sp.]
MDDRLRGAARRRFLKLAAAAPALGAWPGLSRAGAYPQRPLTFVVPFGPGGNVDSVGRLLAAAMGPLLGQTIIVENRAGAGGSVGAALVAQAAPDGYTLMVGSNGPLTVNPFVQARLPYDPLKDFAPITLAGSVAHVLIANKSLAAKTLRDVTELSARQFVGCASSGVGSATHLTLARFNAQTGARIEHVPFRGGNTLVPALLGGDVQLASMEFSTALPLHQAGKARIVAVAAARRSPLAADVPTFIESGVAEFTAQSYVGLLAPARTPADVQAKLEQAANSALGSGELADRLRGLGLDVADTAQRQRSGFAAFLHAEYERSGEAARLAGIKPE